MKKTGKKLFILLNFILCFCFLISGCSKVSQENNNANKNSVSQKENYKTTNSVKNYTKNKLTIHYIDIGQGDSELIQYKGKNILIDAGSNESRNKMLSYLKSTGLKKLDYVIATHPHEDHIGNMDDVVRKYEIGEFIAPKVSTNTKCFEWMIKEIKNKGLKITTAKAGLKFNLDKDVKCEFVAPNNTKYDNLNDYSAILKVTFGKNKFLFTGDAEALSEKEVLAKNYDISANVLKMGHHGSSTSSTKPFLKKVNPKIAIISCGKNNKYGHPHKETVTKLKEMNIKSYRTDIDGDIILVSDGTTIKKLNKK